MNIEDKAERVREKETNTGEKQCNEFEIRKKDAGDTSRSGISCSVFDTCLFQCEAFRKSYGG